MSKYNSKQLTISQLIEAGISFEIPNYQRGYRWGKTEVIDLLEDIMDVVKEDYTPLVLRDICKRSPYCLQPISFDNSKESNNTMIVVDGQQRLTTTFLILKYIASRFGSLSREVIDEFDIDDPDEFCKEISIHYADPTRESVFQKVKSNLESINTENIDAYYITEAYSFIREWGDNNIKKAKALNQFAIKFFYGTSIIWYEIDKTTDGTPNDYFSKTNTGRIPLTNSELIKAILMLDEYCIKKDNTSGDNSSDLDKGKKEDEQRRLNLERLENQRIKMSRQWDSIENALRNDELWYFLTENSDEYEDTRIDFIFNIIARELYPELNMGYNSMKEFFELNRERGAFIIIARYLKENEHRDDSNSLADPIGVYVWKKAWNTYMVFREWFDNREWYHLIGYILSADKNIDAEAILKLFNKSDFFSKKQIREAIVTMTEKNAGMIYVDADGKEVKRTEAEYKKYINGLSYESESDKAEIRKILLLFNVVSVLNDNTESARASRDTFFPFSRYKKENWNLEHIHSKEDGNFSRDFAKAYLHYIDEMIERLKKETTPNKQELATLKKVREIYNLRYDACIEERMGEDEAVRFAAQESCNEWIRVYRDDLDEDSVNGIGNLALLDETTNKSYHNAPFFIKRMIIGDIVLGKIDNVSRFIPFCTRNVFDKTYTKLPSAMMHWNGSDYNDYLDVIVEVLYKYFDKGGEN